MRNVQRKDWATNNQTRRFIFEFLVLKLLWAIFWHVTGKSGRADKVIGMALLDTVDYVEANTTNPASTRETIKAEFGWNDW